MGPFLLPDKSTLQKLSYSKKEYIYLFNEFFVVIPPVLIMEILGDLSKKPSKKFPSSETLASSLANKLFPGGEIPPDFKALCVGSLLGTKIPMSGWQIPIDRGDIVTAENGSSGWVIDEHPLRGIIRDWQRGIFSDSEHLYAKLYREQIKSLNLESTREFIEKSSPVKLKKIFNPFELQFLVESSIYNVNEKHQFKLLVLFMSYLNLPPRYKSITLSRWQRSGNPPFCKFAPYAFHCFKVMYYFMAGFLTRFFSSKDSNIIDMQYLYYLPFCKVFSTGDKQLQKFFFLVKNIDQKLITDEDMKTDLRKINDYWRKLNEDEKEEYAYEYGYYPPEDPDNKIYQVWREFAGPRRKGMGNRALRYTPEESKRATEEIEAIMEAIKKHQHKKEKHI